MPFISGAERKAFTKEDFRDKAFQDDFFFCKELFPSAFYVDFCDTHREIFDLVSSNFKYAGVIAPRKLGKTPIICFAFPMKRILYNLETYIVIVSATQSESERHVMKLIKSLETNEKIHYYFGNFVNRKNRKTTQQEAQFSNGIWLRSKGFLSQIRGTGGDWTPPSLIIVDDIQSNKDVKTEKSLKDAEDWFDDEVIYSAAIKWQHPRFKTLDSGKIRFLGTSLHPQCLAERLWRDKRFKMIRHAICEDDGGEPALPPPYGDGKSIWEEMFSTQFLSDEYRDALASGRDKNWLQERFNQPYKFGDRVFDSENTMIWDVGGNKFDIIAGQPVITMVEDLGIA